MGDQNESFDAAKTAEQIELTVQRRFDSLDAKLMAGTINQERYDALSREISEWADQQYRFRRR